MAGASEHRRIIESSVAAAGLLQVPLAFALIRGTCTPTSIVAYYAGPFKLST